MYLFCTGLKTLQAKKLIRKLKGKLSGEMVSSGSKFQHDFDNISVMSGATNFSMSTERFGSEKSSEYMTAGPHVMPFPSLSHPKAKVSVRYVLCKDLFLLQVQEKYILNLNPNSDTFEQISQLIMCDPANVISGDMVLEFFSHEGYPLNVNEYNKRGKLYCVYFHFVLLLLYP